MSIVIIEEQKRDKETNAQLMADLFYVFLEATQSLEMHKIFVSTIILLQSNFFHFSLKFTATFIYLETVIPTFPFMKSPLKHVLTLFIQPLRAITALNPSNTSVSAKSLIIYHKPTNISSSKRTYPSYKLSESFHITLLYNKKINKCHVIRRIRIIQIRTRIPIFHKNERARVGATRII